MLKRLPPALGGPEAAVTVIAERQERLWKITADVAGFPPIDCYVPVQVRLLYHLRGQEWEYRAWVECQHPDRPHMRRTFDFKHRELFRWPTRVMMLADQLHPDRPGGWPGADPDGFYLR